MWKVTKKKEDQRRYFGNWFMKKTSVRSSINKVNRLCGVTMNYVNWINSTQSTLLNRFSNPQSRNRYLVKSIEEIRQFRSGWKIYDPFIGPSCINLFMLFLASINIRTRVPRLIPRSPLRRGKFTARGSVFASPPSLPLEWPRLRTHARERATLKIV